MVGKFRGSKSGLALRGRGGGRRGSPRPSLPRQKEKEQREEGVGGGSGSTDLQNPPPPPPPGSPSREARTVSSRTARTTLPPSFFFFFLPTSILTRTHIRRLCGFFTPRGKKEQGVERKRRRSEELLLGRALHSEPRLGAGTLLPQPQPPSCLPGLAACASRSANQGTRSRGHRETLAASAAAGRRDSSEKGPATAFPSPPPRPARAGSQAQESKEEQRPRKSAPRIARRWMQRPREPRDNFAG